jgi:hypothetical protein
VRSTVVPLLVVQDLDLGAGWIGAPSPVAALVQASLLLPAGGRSTRSAGADAARRRPAHAVSLAALRRGPAGRAAAGHDRLRRRRALLGVAPAAIVGDVVEGRAARRSPSGR